jgi:hypothetical protein
MWAEAQQSSLHPFKMAERRATQIRSADGEGAEPEEGS